MVLAVLACSLGAQAHSPPPQPPPPDGSEEQAGVDVDADMTDDDEAQAALFDRLRADSSPRQQVLAGRIYLDDDESVPTALRPKREDVVAHAVQLAPDDAFVQWQGASAGSYASSRCGPTTWPDAEVANLIRLEPDNAAAWQFAVALAAAKGDQAGVDEALSRMAAATAADDHFAEQVGEWKKAFAAQPDAKPAMPKTWKAASPETRALFSALQQTAYEYSPVKSEVADICKPDASSDRAWQRLGWCADAARTLASKGGSIALRHQGLELLAEIGEKTDTTAELQRQVDWLEAQSANPMRNYRLFDDPPEDIVSDWRGATSEVAATQRRLQRIGQPLEPPTGWVKESSREERSAAGAQDVAKKIYQAYMKSLANAMRASGDVRQQAVAAGSAKALALIAGDGDTSDATAAANDASMADIAAAHPDDLIVQWVAAHATGTGMTVETTAAAIANVQRLDGDNAAALALSLGSATGDEAQTDAILQRMAASSRYDEHTGDILDIWLDVVERTPPPSEFAEMMRAMSDGAAPPTGRGGGTIGKGIAVMMSVATSTGAHAGYETYCRSNAEAEASARKASCIGIARLQLHSARSMTAMMLGERILETLDGMDARDLERARHLEWWSESLMSAASTESPDPERYFDDVRTAGEVEAMRLAAVRLGKAEPPANWRSPAEKRRNKKAKKAD
jgi:hypothetical protein